jgi:hypothetical protein
VRAAGHQTSFGKPSIFMNPLRWLLNLSAAAAAKRGGQTADATDRQADVEARTFPPVPRWRPSFGQPMDELVRSARKYTNGARDFAVFRHGTLAALPDGLSDAEAQAHALTALSRVFHAHPDMNPLAMKDGNILNQYSNDVATVVLRDVIDRHWDEIQRRHLEALATDEVLITSSGPNVFDDHGKAALFGRCYMFMDALDPQVVRLERKAS